MGESGIKGDVAPIGADFKLVVALWVAGVEMIKTVAEVSDEVDDFDVGLQADDLALPGVQGRQLHGHLVAGDHVGVGRGQREQFGEVGEFADAGDWPQPGARRVDFDGGGRGGERRAPVSQLGNAGLL